MKTPDPVIEALLKKKQNNDPIVRLTAYEAAMAAILEKSGCVDLLLVGDSLGMVVQGKTNTREVTLDQMSYHVQMVNEGTQDIPIVGDLPYHSFENSEEALASARRLIDAGAWGVKFEGNRPEAAAAIVGAGIPLMGHIGLLPQTAETFGVKGRSDAEAESILRDAMALEAAGVFSLVLESMSRDLAAKISRELSIPTIGIGAGAECDGQVLVTYDMIGLTRGRIPKFVKQYTDVGERIEGAVKAYAEEVRNRSYPSEQYSYR